VFAHASGVVTIGDLLSARRALAANSGFSPSFPVLADLRGVAEFAFGMRELELFADLTKAQRSRITALVVSTPVEYGYARMFQSLRDSSNYPTGQIFHDMDSALRWVEEHREDR
jgi:hypothetical protein